MDFSTEMLEEILERGHSGDKWFKVDDITVRTSRWYDVRGLVFASLDAPTEYWLAEFEVGLTEMQDSPMFEDQVPPYRVSREVVTSFEYAPIRRLR